MEIRRLWGGQPRSWWDSMTTEEQAEYLAWWSVWRDVQGGAQ